MPHRLSFLVERGNEPTEPAGCVSVCLQPKPTLIELVFSVNYHRVHLVCVTCDGLATTTERLICQEVDCWTAKLSLLLIYSFKLKSAFCRRLRHLSSC